MNVAGDATVEQTVKFFSVPKGERVILKMRISKAGDESSYFYLFTSILPVIVELPGEKKFS